jgi:superfamily II DNA or RNA helicase
MLPEDIHQENSKSGHLGVNGMAANHTPWTKLPLWKHQKEAVETVAHYMEADSDGSALIRMPTGTGKTGVIATVARALRNIQNVLILTPWAALREQLEKDLGVRFWSKIGFNPNRGRLTWNCCFLRQFERQLTT